MDPVANLERQRELITNILYLVERDDRDDYDLIAAKAAELAELVRALDEWRSKGGFDPYGSASPPSTTPSRVLLAMRAIVDYSWQSEQRDYEECQQDTNDNEVEGHVFLHLQAVDTYLTEQGVE